MKIRILTVFIIMILCSIASLSQDDNLCFRGITTNPLGPPYNPDNVLDGHMTNGWDWTSLNPDIPENLNNVPLDGMYDLYNTFMDHPYSPDNPYSLGNVPYEIIDFWPEDGWELISINTGHFPDETPLSDVMEGSSFYQVPFIVFYNKQRGILRIFGNSLTGLGDNLFDVVIVTLEFDNDDQVSGLLRHSNSIDRAMDQSTSSNNVRVTTDHNNNPSTWFYVDFQVGYDPCTCYFRSDLRLTFDFLDHTDLKMTSRGIYLDQPLVDEDDEGNQQLTIDHDFLSGVTYQDGFATSGTAIYDNMDAMLEDYIAKLDHVIAMNEEIQENNDAINSRPLREKAILWAFQQVSANNPLIQPVGDIGLDIIHFASDIIEGMEISFGEGDPLSIKIDSADVYDQTKKILGQGTDWLSMQLFGNLEEQELLKEPSPPSVTISETTYAGQLTDNSNPIGPVIFNPGTYGNVESMDGLLVTPHNYPVYNEVLGLSALLETPKIKTSIQNSNERLSYETHICEDHNIFITNFFGTEYCTADVVHSVTHPAEVSFEHRFQLAEPLKIVFNPAAEIDVEKTKIYAGFVIENKRTLDFTTHRIYTVPDDGPILDRTIKFNQSSAELHEDFYNLQPYDQKADLAEGSTTPLVYQSPLIPIDHFNEMISGYDLTSKFDFRETHYYTDDVGSLGTNGVYCYSQHINPYAAIGGFDCENDFDNTYQPINTNSSSHETAIDNLSLSIFNLEDVEVKVKLMIDYHFLNPGKDGRKNTTTQVYTFETENAGSMESTTPSFNLSSDLLHENINVIEDHEFEYLDALIEHYQGSGFFDMGESHLSFFAFNDIKISKQVMSTDDILVSYNAGNEISLLEGAHILPDVELKLDSYPSSLTPLVTSEEISNFCNGEGYQAKSYDPTKSLLGLNSSPGKKTKEVQFEKNLTPILRLYPNPSKNVIYIDLEANDTETIYYSIYDTFGRILNSETLGKSQSFIDISSLASGTYILKVHGDFGSAQQRFIKQ